MVTLFFVVDKNSGSMIATQSHFFIPVFSRDKRSRTQSKLNEVPFRKPPNPLKPLEVQTLDLVIVK